MKKTGVQRVYMTLPIISATERREFFTVIVSGVGRANDSAQDVVMRITYSKVNVSATGVEWTADENEISRKTVLKDSVGRVTIKALCDAAKMVSLNTVADVLQKSSEQYFNIFKARYPFVKTDSV